MGKESIETILREIDLFRKENKEDHDEIKKHAEHTNGTVADLVEWKIRVKTILWIFGLFIGSVVVPVGIEVLTLLIKKHF